MPRLTLLGVASTLMMLLLTRPPPSRSTTAETYGAGTPRAARWTMVNVRTTPVLDSRDDENERPPHAAHALRRSK